MHILHDLAIFVIFATISKNRKLLSRYRFTPPSLGGIAAIPPGGYGGLVLVQPPGGRSGLPPGGMASCYTPRGYSSLSFPTKVALS